MTTIVRSFRAVAQVSELSEKSVTCEFDDPTTRTIEGFELFNEIHRHGPTGGDVVRLSYSLS